MPPVDYHYGKFPPKNLDWLQLVPHIGPASRALGDFRGLLNAIPNADVLLAPLSAHEAVLSSRIEGTQVTLGEVLEFEADGGRHQSPGRRHEIREVYNYRRAIHQATELLDELPLCGRLLKKVHVTLMEDVRGKNMQAGEFKSIPNFIGSPGCTVETAKFIPCTPDKLHDGITEWEKFLHDDYPDSLVQLAVVHAEFEAIHPFYDGNGRLGRMLMPLFLFERKLLSYPSFYMSEYLEAHREEYYERLLAVSRDDDWTGWCRFFLQALEKQADENTRKTRAILDLYEERKHWIIERTRSQYAVPSLDFIFQQPVFRSPEFGKNQNVPHYTAHRILSGIRNELFIELSPSSGSRPAILAYEELIDIVEQRRDF